MKHKKSQKQALKELKKSELNNQQSFNIYNETIISNDKKEKNK